MSRKRLSIRLLITSCLLLVVTPSVAAGEELESTIEQLTGLSPEDTQKLVDDGELTRRYYDEASALFAPAFGDPIRTALEELDPSIGVEVLFLRPGFEEGGSTEIDLRTYNILRSISTMEGIEYYSASRERMRTLFYESYVISSPDSRERQPDPLLSSIPAESSIFVYQRDSSFARNVYEIRYTVEPGEVWVSMENLTPLLYRGLVPALGKSALQIHLVVRPIGDYLLFYGNAGTDPIGLLGMEERAGTSFYNRLVALANWFSHQLLTNG